MPVQPALGASERPLLQRNLSAALGEGTLLASGARKTAIPSSPAIPGSTVAAARHFLLTVEGAVAVGVRVRGIEA